MSELLDIERKIQDILESNGLVPKIDDSLELNMMHHVIDCLGALVKLNSLKKSKVQTNHSNSERNIFCDVVKYLSDQIVNPPTESLREPYPVKWLRESFPGKKEIETQQSWKPLHWCAYLGHEKSVSTILDLRTLCREHKSKPHISYDVSPLSLAVSKAKPSMPFIQTLLDEFPLGASVADSDGAFPFMYSCAWNDTTEVVSMLHQRNPQSVHVSDIYGFKALHYASYVGSTSVIQYLLEVSPAFAQEANMYGVLPLSACAVNVRAGTVGLKLIYGAYPEAISIPDNEGMLPLHKAAQYGTLDMVNFLLENLPDASFCADKEGLLPMHYAALRADKSLAVQQCILESNPNGIVDTEFLASIAYGKTGTLDSSSSSGKGSGVGKGSANVPGDKDCKMM
jgi:ankyrin repeat protein